MPFEILAAISHGNTGAPRIEPALLDDPLADEMVIRMGAASMCHTDIGASSWLPGKRVLGHEGAGTIVALGSDVGEFAIGDRVVATFASCGACRNCKAERPAYCFTHAELNFEGARSADQPAITLPDGEPIAAEFFQQSAFATYALVTKRNCVKLPDDLGFAEAAPLGCGVQTGAGAVVNSFAAQAGWPLLVIGCGAVGLSAVMAGRIIGCDPIIAVDLLPARRTIALEMGATHALDGADAELVAAIHAIAPGGVSYALDTAGTQHTYEASLAALHPGGQCGVVTLPGGFGEPVPHPGGITFMNTSTIGIIEGDSFPTRFIPWLIEQHQRGQLPYDKLITRYRFEDIATAYEDLKTGRAIKPVLLFD